MSAAGRRGFWRIQLAVWSSYGVIHFLAALPVVAPADLHVMALIKLVRAATGLGASSLLAPLYRRTVRFGARRVAIVAVLASAIASQLWFLVDRTALVTLAGAAGLTIDWNWFPRGLELDYVFVLVAWSAGFLVIHYAGESAARERQALEREVALRNAQLEALSYQLSPHFLFNTLNSIRALITEDTGRAREMVTRLSRFLNATLAAGQATTLGEELATVGAYLEIQQARFEDALEVRVEDPGAAAGCPVPTLILQPLVENAIQHGAREAGALRIRIRAERAGELLRIVVSNTGRMAPGAGPLERAGIGLGNVRARLASFYASAPRLTFAEEGGWVSARIEVDHPERNLCAR